MHIIELLKALLLGFVEGMTEFAPVSSTGHMIIVDDMWLQTTEFLGKYSANTFKVVIQLGSILAVIVVFWKRLFSLIGLYKIEGEHDATGTHKLKLRHVLIGLLPAAVLGLLFEDFIDENLFSIETVIIGLAVGALLMIAADKLGPKEPKTTSLDQITYRQAALVGLFQCISLWPGFSRSGSTISGGVFLGMNHRTAADFTFIMAVPIMFGASFLSLVKNWDNINAGDFGFYAVGFIASFVFALLSIRFFLKLINKIKLVPFAIYRLVLAAILAIVVYM
ncbi:undecaprenyl-diphosphate phosphatase [Exiguobacterium sp. TDN 0502]|uniref:undecaprenyl-diphosphate phosphatase n=1 Tax=Exiguobacterium sp. TDN 0502 TaxID=3420731 RepID=UPI003D77888A